MGNISHDFKKLAAAGSWLYPRFMGSQRWGHSACFSNGFLYIFGGCCGGLHFSDVLMLNIETMTWTNLVTTGVGPGPRDSHSAVIVGDMMIVFGGTNGSKKVNDIHILDLLTHEWTQPNCKGVVPTPRESHTVTVVSHELLVIFGGSGEGDANYLNDLHILDLKTMKWSSPQPKGDVPMPRDSHIAVFIDGKIFVYGGDCGDRYRGDVDVFDVDTLTWSRFVVQGPSPGVRAGHAAVTIGTKVYMIGGVGEKQYYNDVWMLDTIACSWTQLEVRGRQPQGRFSHTAIVVDSEIVVYGGCGEDERPLNELLILQLATDHLNDNDGCNKIIFGSKCSPQHFFHRHHTNMKQLWPDTTMHMRSRRRRRKLINSKACEVIESEPEEHSYSPSDHSDDREQTQLIYKKPAAACNSSTPQVLLPLFKNNHINQISRRTPPGTQSNPIMILSTTSPDPNATAHHHQNNIANATPAQHRNIEPFQNLVGAEVHGKVDGAFDSGYLMTATVNGRIFRGVLFPPGPEVGSGGTFKCRSSAPTSGHTTHRNNSNTNLQALKGRSAFDASELANHHIHSRNLLDQDPTHDNINRSVPGLSLGMSSSTEQANDQLHLHGVVLTLGGGPGNINMHGCS